MKLAAIVLTASALSLSPALAQTSGTDAMQACSAKAMSKDGKPLAGAAKASAMKKCCEAAAVSKDGKPLAGAAKASFVKKCTS